MLVIFLQSLQSRKIWKLRSLNYWFFMHLLMDSLIWRKTLTRLKTNAYLLLNEHIKSYSHFFKWKKKNLAGSSGSRSVTLHCMWSNCCPLKIACDRSSFFFAFGNRKECMMREPLSILILRENHVSYQPHHFSFWNEVKGVRSHRWRCLQERISFS